MAFDHIAVQKVHFEGEEKFMYVVLHDERRYASGSTGYMSPALSKEEITNALRMRGMADSDIQAALAKAESEKVA